MQRPEAGAMLPYQKKNSSFLPPLSISTLRPIGDAIISMFGSFSWWCEKRKERREEARSVCAQRPDC
jgi:hypothetical protein